MADKFEDLRTYVAIVENGGINAAAASLAIAKSAVSRRLGELEARLGVTLIARTTRSFELTALGRDYHRRAKAILASLAELDEGVVGELPSPVVRIAVERTVPVAAVLPGVAGFQVAGEAVGIEIAPFDGNGEHDADVRVSSAVDRGREGREIASFRWILVAAPSYLKANGNPGTPSDLEAHRGIGIASSEVANSGGRSIRRARDLVIVPDFGSAFDAAVAGIGMTRLPDFIVSAAIGEGLLSAVLGDQTGSPTVAYASYRADADLVVKRLVDCLAAEGPRTD